jgi:UDP-3-O-[3-hydroxymyristoyl] glucosamine N-acyltransferase
MATEVRSWTLGELASLLDGQLAGPPELRIDTPAPAGQGHGSSLTFAGDEKHLTLAEASEVGAVLVGAEMSSTKPHIKVANPKGSFGKFLTLCSEALPIQKGIHPTVVVDPRAHVDPSASIGAFAVIEQNADVGPGCRVYPFCYVGEGCRLHEGVVLYPHAVLYQNIEVGARSIIHSGTVLGADGFGYVWNGETHVKIPQVGNVVIGANVEIGSLTAIDRAMIGETVIGDDTKVDNLVQIGHNTRIGKHTIIASQTGIAGSCEIGDRVVMAGKVGIADHVTIADDVTLTAGAATTIDVDEPGVYKGFPLRPVVTAQRLDAMQLRLPDMMKRIKELERKIAELESREK